MFNQKILGKSFSVVTDFMTNSFVDFMRLQQGLSELAVYLFLFFSHFFS
jgi:hypothetical protein